MSEQQTKISSLRERIERAAAAREAAAPKPAPVATCGCGCGLPVLGRTAQ